jgi:hypothetical protein
MPGMLQRGRWQTALPERQPEFCWEFCWVIWIAGRRPPPRAHWQLERRGPGFPDAASKQQVVVLPPLTFNGGPRHRQDPSRPPCPRIQ